MWIRARGFRPPAKRSPMRSPPVETTAVRERDADYASITVKEINALAKKYLSAENALLIGIKPKE